MPRSQLADDQIIALYLSKTPLSDIAHAAQVTRQAIHNTLKRHNITVDRKQSLALTCLFCGEKFERPASLNKNPQSGYCTVQCFHANRSASGLYSPTVSSLESTHDKEQKSKHKQAHLDAVESLRAAGIELQLGEVVHYIDGDRSNNNIENLKVFSSHSQHIQFHHAQRRALQNKTHSV